MMPQYANMPMYISLIFNDLPCEAQLHLRFINFINKAMSSSNNIVRLCANSAISGSKSSTCRNINYIRWRYDININDSVLALEGIITL